MTTPHRRLVALYEKLLALTDRPLREVATVHLDPRTWRMVSHDPEAHADGSVLMDHPQTWRMLSVELHWRRIPEAPVTDDPVDWTTSVDEPFCMYIELALRSGRRQYIDDPETHQEFLT